jgi:CheY-like chemotaxis protein
MEETIRQPQEETKVATIENAGTVLLVDDDLIVLQVTTAMLSKLGFTVLSAMDGIDAVRVYRQHQDEICLVLSDVAMPRMNGWETLIALRQITPNIPVILASGYSEEQVMEGIHHEHPQAFLAKPYGFDVLRGAIHLALKDGRACIDSKA